MSLSIPPRPIHFSLEITNPFNLSTLKKVHIYRKKPSSLKACMSPDVSLRELLDPSLLKTVRKFHLLKSEDKDKKLYFFGDRFLSVLRKNLSKARCLDDLSALVPFSHKMTDLGLFHFKNIITQLKILQNAQIKLGGIGSSNVTQSGLTTLLHSLSSLSKAETVETSLLWGQKAVHHNVAKRLGFAISRLKKVKSLCIKMPGSHIGDESLYEVLRMTPAYTHLKELVLDFSSCLMLTDHAIKRIVSIVSKLATLKTQTTSIVGCKLLTIDGLAQYYKAISENPQIEQLGLSLLCLNQLTDNFMTNLSASLTRMSRLTELHLTLGQCDRVSNRGILSLAKALVSLNNFQALTLDLYPSEKISCGGIVNFLEELGRSRSFKTLKLNIWRQLYHNNLTEIMQAISKLNNLLELEISLFYLHEVSDEEIAKMGTRIHMPRGLKKLGIRLTDCRKVSRIAVSQLKKRLEDSHSSLMAIQVNDTP